ncbi:MAG: hypothetical protein MMC33_003713 [Icmadophila ericetorum]|nr:hypothetical protein [Icmadophila ericetorum]
MAGMEQLEIHSKSYLVRWVSVQPEWTISWSIQPHKKSINFGIFKHPGSGVAPTPKLQSSTFESHNSPVLQPVDVPQDSSTSLNTSSSTIEKLKGLGWKLVTWYGACEAAQVSSGKYDVPKEEGGLYALIFDNTFAKSFSKTATFILHTYPTDSPPLPNHQVHDIAGANSSTSSLRSNQKPILDISQSKSSESIAGAGSTPPETHAPSRRQEKTGSNAGLSFYTGVLKKKRRKRNQGWARRFFSLDFTSATLCYYHDQNTLALRGTAPLSVAVIGSNSKTREFSIDSGAEIWHLRASNQKEFEAWKGAFEKAAQAHMSNSVPNGLQRQREMKPQMTAEEEQDWARVEALVGRVAGSRNALRRLAQETDPKYASLGASTAGLGLASSMDFQRMQDTSSVEGSPTEKATTDDSPNNHERFSSWKRKASNGRPMSKFSMKRSVSAQPSIPSRKGSLASESIPLETTKTARLPDFPEESLHEHCMSILRDLDSVVAEFSTLLAETRQRRMPEPTLRSSRLSIESQEFFDAEGGEGSQIVAIHIESGDEDEEASRESGTLEEDSRSDSDVDDTEYRLGDIHEHSAVLYPPKVKNLFPLPLQAIKRRSEIPGPVVAPPSLWKMVSVGLDLTVSSFPAAANEPISLLQRISEQLEYSHLLDEASNPSLSSAERLLRVAAFAISSLSVIRVKTRAHRKPFNPMLGETFELVREDRGFRFIAEKVCHHPVILACQAESDKWSFAQTPMPEQKFWGRSAELITDGLARLSIHSTEDRFSYATATCSLNAVGEKYAEPKGQVVVINETTGERAVISFRPRGMFSGRSEEVTVKVFDSSGSEMPLGLVGKWTESLKITKQGAPQSRPIWIVGDLVPNPEKCYGFTTFTASLNEITAHEQGKLPPTDSRLRPDQRAVETGDMDTAETLKGRLEDRQRERRSVLQDSGEEYKPAWFYKVDGPGNEKVFKLKNGREGYWETRSRGEWNGVTDIFET